MARSYQMAGSDTVPCLPAMVNMSRGVGHHDLKLLITLCSAV